ncbi:hypothetical protein OG565_08065 [Streptomyces sp. NBC_00138]
MQESDNTVVAEPAQDNSSQYTYAAPVVVDGGEVVSVTLGRNGANRQDRTEYYDK